MLYTETNSVLLNMKPLFIVCVVLTILCANLTCAANITLDDFLDGKLNARGWNGRWISGNEFIYRKSQNGYMKYDVVTKTEVIFISEQVLTQNQWAQGASITLTADNKYALVKYDVQQVYRHSTTAKYAVLTIETSAVKYVSQKDDMLTICLWNTDSSLVFVKDGALKYVADVTAADLNGVDIQPKEDFVYSGVPDWVYEEEVFGSGEAMWFSPGGHIAFARFDDTSVPLFTYILYPDDDSYTTPVEIKYPKADEINPKFELLYRAVGATENKPFKLVKDGNEVITMDDSTNFVLYGAAWLSDQEVLVFVTNRIQNKYYQQRCTVEDFTCTLEAEVASSRGWLTPFIPVFNGDRTKRAVIAPSATHPQLFVHYGADSKLVSEDGMTVTGVYGFAGNILYYSGNTRDNYTFEHVYKVDTAAATPVPECLTCEYAIDGTKCLHVTASFSTDLTHAAISCRGPRPTHVSLRKLNDFANEIVAWETNEELMTILADKESVGTMDIVVDMESYKTYVRLILPSDFSASNKYPLLIEVYGGPDSNQISEVYSAGIEKYMVSSRNFIYGFIDGRGSARLGLDYAWSVYKKLGQLEIEDQIKTTKYLQDTYSFIDANKTGIWGWSYGGFSTAHVMAADTDNVFKFGVSVAPVTNFKLYDSIYTERYMDTPTNNRDGYTKSDVTKNVENFKQKKYLLVHGNADDNVHYQHSMLLAKALESADILFEQMSYPDEAHSIGGQQHHLYHTLDRFWAEAVADPEVVYVERGGASSIAVSAILSLLSAVFIFYF